MLGPMCSVARYDQAADFYVAEVGDAVTDPGTAGLLRLAGDVGHRRLLDLACGQGRVARELARRGARVVGVDISAALIARAGDAERAAPLGIAYVVGDASRVLGLEVDSFDGVVCNYGLSDVDDLGGALDSVTSLLRPGGFLVFSILHPCFPGWGDDVSSSWPPGRGYFAEGWWRRRALLRDPPPRWRQPPNHLDLPERALPPWPARRHRPGAPTASRLARRQPPCRSRSHLPRPPLQACAWVRMTPACSSSAFPSRRSATTAAPCEPAGGSGLGMGPSGRWAAS
jgi:SAM-dependent methyltransferase